MDDPLSDGAVHETTTLFAPAVAVTEVGASGPLAGTTGLDDADGFEFPFALVATTVNV
jgi:hypothetical protein